MPFLDEGNHQILLIANEKKFENSAGQIYT